MMSEFKRENRFIVVKLKDASPRTQQFLRSYLATCNLPERQYVVVESDWPEYEQVWAMIEARVDGKPSPYEVLEQQLKALRQHKSDYMEAAEGTRRALTRENKRLRSELAELRRDAERYRWLRARDLDSIHKGGVFAGMTPENVVLNREDLDSAVDARRDKGCRGSSP